MWPLTTMFFSIRWKLKLKFYLGDTLIIYDLWPDVAGTKSGWTQLFACFNLSSNRAVLLKIEYCIYVYWMIADMTRLAQPKFILHSDSGADSLMMTWLNQIGKVFYKILTLVTIWLFQVFPWKHEFQRKTYHPWAVQIFSLSRLNNASFQVSWPVKLQYQVLGDKGRDYE